MRTDAVDLGHLNQHQDEPGALAAAIGAGRTSRTLGPSRAARGLVVQANAAILPVFPRHYLGSWPGRPNYFPRERPQVIDPKNVFSFLQLTPVGALSLFINRQKM
jgi:hypothetical protein